MVVASLLLLGGTLAVVLAVRSKHRVVDAGFWFEHVSYDASEAMAERLRGGLTAQEIETISSIASREVFEAFAGLRITFSDRRDATYRVRVVQYLRSPGFVRMFGPAGTSRSVAGFGGLGAVSFRTLANNAIAYAPDEADRSSIIAAIGRGIGRAAVHEFAHQLLGTAPLHDTTNVRSYEYGSADRREQYYDVLH